MTVSECFSKGKLALKDTRRESLLSEIRLLNGKFWDGKNGILSSVCNHNNVCNRKY